MKNFLKNTRNFQRNRDGNILLEFAIGSGILVAVFVGTFQFGYSFLQYNNLENAVERGARYASLIDYDSATDTPASDYQTAVQNMVIYGDPSGGTSPVLPGLAATNVNVTACGISTVCPGYATAPGVPQEVTVYIDGYTIDSVFAQTSLSHKPSVTFPYQGFWEPF